MKRDTGVYPGIKRLQTFITSIAEDVNDPVYGYQEDRTKKLPSVKPAKSHHSRSFNITTVPGSNRNTEGQHQYSTAQSQNAQFKHICPLCNEYHRLFGCQKLKLMKPVDRLNFVKCKKLCENCLLGNHTTDVCRKPGRCTVCGAKHTRFIHIIDEGSANCVTANSVANNYSQVNHSSNDNDISVTHDAQCNVSKQVLLPVVPITFALLDSGSTNSFRSRALVDNLNIKGVKTVFHLSTLDTIPVHCLDRELFSSYDHLKGIKLPSTGQVDVLIGQDYPDALIPLEV